MKKATTRANLRTEKKRSRVTRTWLGRPVPAGVRGLLALHLSNRYLSLEPVVANLAEDARLDGRLLRHDLSPATEGASASTWAVLAYHLTTRHLLPARFDGYPARL